MPDVVADLDPQTDADASPDVVDRFANDKSVNTAVEAPSKPVEVETEAETVDAKPESVVDSSPAEVEVLEEKADPSDDIAEDSANVKERIDKLTERFRQQERDNAGLRQENAHLRKQNVAKPAEDDPLKTLADFEYDEGKFQSYLGSEIDRRATLAGERAALGVQAKVDNESREDVFRRGEKEFAADQSDYFDLVYGTVDGARRWAASDAMVEEIMLSDMGQPLAYYLASNPDIAKDISVLNPRETAIRMDRLQVGLKATKDKVNAEKKKVTKAPPPVPKIPAGDAALTKGPADMSDKEFSKWRRKQIANR